MYLALYALIFKCTCILKKDRRQGGGESERAGEREGGSEQKDRVVEGGAEAGVIFVCVCLAAVRLVLMSGAEGAPLMLCFRGDCHQLASWHLNHLLQIRVFEMQIHCICPDKLKYTESKHF